MCNKELNSRGSDKTFRKASRIIDDNCGINNDSEVLTAYAEIPQTI